MTHVRRPQFARSLRLALAVAAVSFTGGCASSFRYDADDAPPPAAQLRPTTVPSNEVADTSTFSGVLEAAFVEFPIRVYEFATGQTPTSDVAAMEDSKLPDRRRLGINNLVDRSFGKQPPYTGRYAQIAGFDADPSVRAVAIRALNRSRDGSATGRYIAALVDESPAVRLEGAKALSNIPDEAATTGLLKVFTNTQENLDVRIAAADALRQYRSLEIARALVNGLNERDFGLAWQARQSLRTMTGEDKRYDQSAWLQLLTEKPLG